MTRLQWMIPLLAIVLSTITGYFFSSTASSQLARLGSIDSPALVVSQSLVFTLATVEDQLKSAVAAADKDMLKAAGEKAAAFRKDVESLGAIAGQEQLAAAIRQDFDAYFDASTKVAEILLSGKVNEAGEASQAMQVAHAALTKQLGAAKAEAQATLTGNITGAQSSVRNGLVASLLGSLIVLVVSFVVSQRAVWRVMRDLGGRPAYAKGIVQRIANGDLSVPIDLRAGDTDSLLCAMQGMQRQLAQTISDVRASVSLVSSSTAGIASGSSQLCGHMSGQEQSLVETASRIEQLTESVRHNAENAQQANRLASSASSEAESGGQAVSQAVATMDEINQSARKIVEITSVIDGIAFQTNILALNAAVEAARAGEQGRGFAVVAAEVRSLAQRAGSAAKEIKGLIDDSVTRIDAGSQYAHAAGAAMTNLVASVKRVGDLIADISTVSTEQSGDIERVNRAIAEIKAATQQNASLVQQAADAALGLQQVAERLDQGVSIFELSGSPATAARGLASPVYAFDGARGSSANLQMQPT